MIILNLYFTHKTGVIHEIFTEKKTTSRLCVWVTNTNLKPEKQIAISFFFFFVGKKKDENSNIACIFVSRVVCYVRGIYTRVCVQFSCARIDYIGSEITIFQSYSYWELHAQVSHRF